MPTTTIPTPPIMTLQEFARTRRYVTDLSEELGEGWEDEIEEAPAGFVYQGRLYIEAVQPHWPEDQRAQGSWCLTIGNEQHVTDKLGELEERLYHYAVDEGIIGHPEGNVSLTPAGKQVGELKTELAQLRTAIAVLGEGFEARTAELAKLKRGYDVMRTENMDMARVLGDLLRALDNPGWHGAIQRGRKLLTKHEDADRG